MFIANPRKIARRAALNPYTKTMLLTTLHWPDEVRSLEELDIPDDEIEVKPAERKMAEQLDYVPMPGKVVGAVQNLWAAQIKDPSGKPVYAISR